MTLRAVIACALFCVWPVVAAQAALPGGYQLVLKGGTLDARAVPPVLALPTGATSTIGLDVAMKLVPHDADDLLLYDSNDGMTHVVRPRMFQAPALTATFYDPTPRATRSARVMSAVGSHGPRISVGGAPAEDMATLLADTGAVLLFYLPEPGLGTGVAAGLGMLSILARRRRA